MREGQGLSAWMTLLFAAACGLVVANIYYAQPLAGPISRALGMHPGSAGLIVTLTQIGYGIGLFLVVPLGDLVENRRLVLVLLGLSALALLCAAFATHPATFLVAALLIGVSSVAVQVLVPYAAHMAPEAHRGRVVGNVMAGLMLGIMLARPTGSFVAQLTSWPVVFKGSAVLMVVVAAVLWHALPPRIPPATLRYGALLRSMAHLLRTTPVLQRRSAYHFFLFGAFSLFWTTTPLLLAGPVYHLTQVGIALFALAGVAGAIAAPLAGRVADSGWSKPATAGAMACVALAFVLTHLAPAGSTLALGLLVFAAILLDFGVSAHMALSQRAIFSLGAAERSRLNGVYMTIFFLGGAVGSATGGWAYSQGGWLAASLVGIALPVIAGAIFLTE